MTSLYWKFGTKRINIPWHKTSPDAGSRAPRVLLSDQENFTAYRAVARLQMNEVCSRSRFHAVIAGTIPRHLVGRRIKQIIHERSNHTPRISRMRSFTWPSSGSANSSRVDGLKGLGLSGNVCAHVVTHLQGRTWHSISTPPRVAVKNSIYSSPDSLGMIFVKRYRGESLTVESLSICLNGPLPCSSAS